jgi:hypothetical protein
MLSMFAADLRWIIGFPDHLIPFRSWVSVNDLQAGSPLDCTFR